MSKILRSLTIIIFFLMPCLTVGMEPKLPTVKIQTKEKEFEIPLDVARVSETLKNMFEDIGEAGTIPLANISEQQFDLLLPVMQSLAQLHRKKSGASKEDLATQLQLIATSSVKPLSNKKLIEFIAGANFLDLPLVEPALKELATRRLSKNDIQKLEALQNKLKDLWDIHFAKRMFSFKHPGGSVNVKKSRDGSLISWSSGNGTIRVWNKNDFQNPITLLHPQVIGVIESVDGNYLISWSNVGTIKIWDKNNLLAEPITLHKDVTGVIESRDGKCLISWSFSENSITVWNKTTFKALITLPHETPSGVIESRDGKYLISWSTVFDIITIWDKNNLLAEPITLEHDRLSGVIASANGNLISWSEEEGAIKVWDIPTSKELATLPHAKVFGVIESMNGNLISWSGEEGTIKVWDMTTFKELATLPHTKVFGVKERVNGNLISWSEEEGTIKVWSIPTFKELITLPHPMVTGVVDSDGDGNLISWNSQYGNIKVWDEALFNPTPEHIQLLFTVYFASKREPFTFTTQELAAHKAALDTLSPVVQGMLEIEAPDFIAAVKKA